VAVLIAAAADGAMQYQTVVRQEGGSIGGVGMTGELIETVGLTLQGVHVVSRMRVLGASEGSIGRVV
jgi:hypothetical protein